MEKNEYYKKVWEITEINCKNIPDIEKRGKDFHLDHIIPISFGFRYFISEEIIGAESNLRIISRKENFLKNCLVNDEVKSKLKEFNINPETLTKRIIKRIIKRPLSKVKEIPIEKEIEPDLSTQNKKSLLYYLPSNKK